VVGFAALHGQVLLAVVHGLLLSVVWGRIGALSPLLRLVAMAAAVQFAGGALAAVLAAWQGRFPTLLVVAYSLATAVLLALAALRARHAEPPVSADTAQLQPRALARLIPLAAVFPSFGILVALAGDGEQEPLFGLALGATVLTGLAFWRQAAAARALLRSERTALDTEARFEALVRHSSDVITIVDADGAIRYVSPSMASVFGHDPAALVGTRLTALVHPDDALTAQQFLLELSRAAPADLGATAGVLKREWRVAHASGGWMTADTVGTNLVHEPRIGGLVLNTRDVTEQSVIKEQYMHQAFHDPLTDMANRSLFLYQVGHALARAQRQSQAVTVMFIDLDNFKTVNDSLGHAAGDRLLVEAARRLATCVRGSDLIARLGGDEFAVLLEETRDVTEALQVAERVGTAFARPFVLAGKEVFVTSSIGIARTEHGETSDELVRNADLAMYVAKQRGKGQSVLFEPRMHAAALQLLDMQADLSRAIDLDEFFLVYQPIVELATGHVIGAEALVRWRSPERGVVPPGVFIPLAEDTGLIVAIGRWVLRRACREARRWTEERRVPVRISVNLSGRQLQSQEIVEDVRQALEESGLDASQLVLELTESMAMQNTDLTMARLTALKALGVAIAIDDFGTGYSSLSYLQRFPVDILKIDKAFVDVVEQGADGSVLATAIVGLSETLRMTAVAEGIETESQRQKLLSLGCEFGQGYLFAPALSTEEFWPLLLSRGARAAVAPRWRRPADEAAA
jgi:diguanylate cyclase (GGDEF)-like protein/PAS domain S-box-containing protein